MRKQANKLPGKPVTKVTKKPGETKHIFGFKINQTPLAWMVDTPGLMVPSIDDPETGLKLALVGCVREGIVEKELLVNYSL